MHAFIFFALLATSSLAACAPDRCDIDPYTAQRADSDAVDCGSFGTQDDPSTGFQCALDAQTAGQPFVLRVDRFGRDSLVSFAYVATRSNERYVLSRKTTGEPVRKSGARVFR